MKFQGLTIGVPKEIMAGEKRVAVTPETVKKFVDDGARVLVQSGAGEGSFIDDEKFTEAGAELAADAGRIFAEADIILKVKEPQFNQELDQHEAELVGEGKVLVSFLHPATPSNHDAMRTLAERNVISYTMDAVPRISRAQKMDALTSMSTAAGYKSAIIAANHLKRFVPMLPTALGTIKPAKFLVIGAGVAGLQAIGTAKRLGARVSSLDIRPQANEQAKSLGASLLEFEVPEELAMAEGGYAQRLPEEWYEKERELIKSEIEGYDAIILSALIHGEKAPVLITEEMVKMMKKGSVIVDISIDQGGNCELSRGGEEFVQDGVMISAILNIPTSVCIDSTRMYAQNIYSFVDHLVEDGEIQSDSDDQIIRETNVTLNGEIVHRGTLRAMEEV